MPKATTRPATQLVIDLNPITKTGEFEIDVRADFYREDKSCCFYDDHTKWLIEIGVPEKYAKKVASYAWQHGHAYGHSEVLNVSYDLIDIFKERS